MGDEKSTADTWLPVIGNALAYLCLEKHSEKNPEDTDTVLKKVKFLTGLGVPSKDAAEAVGSSVQSVRVMTRRRKGAKRGARR